MYRIRMIKKYQNDKEVKPSYQVIRYSEFHVSVCYNIQPVHVRYVQAEDCNTCCCMKL